MADIFLYGSLRHVPLLEIVLGRDVAPNELKAGFLDRAEVRWDADAPFPMIQLGQGSGVSGLVLCDASDTDRARLDFYEGEEDYTLQPNVLADGRKVELFVPGAILGEAGAIWSFEDWQSRYSEFACFAATELMEYFGVRDVSETDRMWPQIEARAAAQLRAKTSRATGLEFPGKVNIHSRSKAYANFFALDNVDLQFEKFDGTLSAPVNRDVFMGMDATIVLPYDPVRDCVLLVEQMRMGPLARGDAHVWQLEPVAGIVDAHETPEEAARREAKEEAGLEIVDLIPVAETYPSTGASSEFYYIYVAITDLPETLIGTGGLEAEGEDIRSHILSYDTLIDMLDDQRIADAPLVIAGYWLARHRERLRSRAQTARG